MVATALAAAKIRYWFSSVREMQWQSVFEVLFIIDLLDLMLQLHRSDARMGLTEGALARSMSALSGDVG